MTKCSLQKCYKTYFHRLIKNSFNNTLTFVRLDSKQFDWINPVTIFNPKKEKKNILHILYIYNYSNIYYKYLIYQNL